MEALDETLLRDASGQQWRALDEVISTLPSHQRLAVLNAVLDSRRGGVEPRLGEIETLVNMVSGRPISVEFRAQQWLG